jgi:uncharacterized membrane protein YfcA
VHLSAAELTVALTAVLAGSFVRGSVGFGVNILAAPLLAFVEPEAVPATLVIAAIPLALGMVLREHRHVDRGGLTWLLIGRVPGTALGAWLVAMLAAESLAVAVGVLVLVAVAMAVAAPPIPVNRTSALTIGAVSGAMGTTAAIGGPPVALLYQHHPGPVLRATSGAVYLAGTVLSVAALAVAGQVDADDVRLALVLLPAIGTGLGLATLLRHRIDTGLLRPAVLVVAVVAGVATLLRGLT